MSKIRKIVLAGFLFSLICGLSIAAAAVPHLINYQGRLTDSGGTPLNGSYQLTFRIYDAETAGNLLWEETHSGVVIQKGIFGILLGSVTNLNLPFDKQYYLEIKVGSEVMNPRQRLATAGYAIRTEKAENSFNADKLDNQPASYYLTHSNLTGLSNNDHPQHVRGQANNYKVDSGSVDGMSSLESRNVSFHFAFSSPPVVVVTYKGDLGGDEHGNLSVFNVSTTGFTIRNARPNISDTRSAYWIAIGIAQ